MNIQLKYIYPGVKGILRHEGLMHLISRGFVFVLSRFYMFESHYVVSYELSNTHEVPLLPEGVDYCLKIVTTNQEADRLLTEGFDFGAYELNLRVSLDRGAIAWCTFIGRELAHITCSAENQQGKDTIDPTPFNVDFQNSEIVTGKALSVPKFRRHGITKFSGPRIRSYYLEKGTKRIKSTIRVNNLPALASATKIPDIVALSKCQYRIILGFKFLKEMEMEP